MPANGAPSRGPSRCSERPATGSPAAPTRSSARSSPSGSSGCLVADLVESPEQGELRAALRRLFGGPSACLARPEPADDGCYDSKLWGVLAGEIGLCGLSLPELYGGSGYSRADRAAAMLEMGRCLLPSPFLASAVLAAETLLAADARPTAGTEPTASDDDVLADVLPGLAA